MKSLRVLFYFICFLSFDLKAQDLFKFSGSLDLNFHHFYETTDKSPGIKGRANFKSETNLNEKLSLTNEMRFLYFSFYDTYPPKGNLTSNAAEVYLGENYLNIDLNNAILKIGYQEIVWGEAFGLHFADIVTPSDLRETFYFDYNNSRLPNFLVNAKFLIENGSLQLIYGPEVKFNKSLPLEYYLKNEIGNINFKIAKEGNLSFFKENDFGVKLSKTFNSFDISYFYFDYVDRSPYLALTGISNAGEILLQEEYSKVQTHGLSMAKTIRDRFVLRGDFVYNKDKIFNSFNNYNLNHYKSNSVEWLLSLDLPQVYNLSSTLIFANSTMNHHENGSFRDKREQYAIIKISKDFTENRILDFSYSKEMNVNSHSLLSLFSWGYTDDLDLRLGVENYWGKDGNLSKLKPTNSVFIGLKKYLN